MPEESHSSRSCVCFPPELWAFLLYPTRVIIDRIPLCGGDQP